MQRVNDAVNLLNDYNNRLAVEVELRKKVTTMIRDFLVVQKELLEQAEQNLEVSTFIEFLVLVDIKKLFLCMIY